MDSPLQSSTPSATQELLNAQSARFQRSLQRVYQHPQGPEAAVRDASRIFETYARQHGVRAAAEAMRTRPEQFGQLRDRTARVRVDAHRAGLHGEALWETRARLQSQRFSLQRLPSHIGQRLQTFLQSPTSPSGRFAHPTRALAEIRAEVQHRTPEIPPHLQSRLQTRLDQDPATQRGLTNGVERTLQNLGNQARTLATRFRNIPQALEEIRSQLRQRGLAFAESRLRQGVDLISSRADPVQNAQRLIQRAQIAHNASERATEYQQKLLDTRAMAKQVQEAVSAVRKETQTLNHLLQHTYQSPSLALQRLQMAVQQLGGPEQAMKILREHPTLLGPLADLPPNGLLTRIRGQSPTPPPPIPDPAAVLDAAQRVGKAQRTLRDLEWKDPAGISRHGAAILPHTEQAGRYYSERLRETRALSATYPPRTIEAAQKALSKLTPEERGNLLANQTLNPHLARTLSLTRAPAANLAQTLAPTL